MNMGNIIALIKSLGGGSVPKPLTYDYMPEGYPSKSVQTEMLYEESEADFVYDEYSGYGIIMTDKLEIIAGQIYVVKFDGREYELVANVAGIYVYIGNLALAEPGGEDTGEPFVILSANDMPKNLWVSATVGIHSVSLSCITEIITPMAEEFLPPSIKSSGKVYKFYSEAGTSAPQHISDDGTIGALVTWDEAKQACEEWLNGEASIRILIYKRLTEGEDNTWANPIAVRQRAADSSGSTFDIVFDTMYGGSLKQVLVPYSS